MNAQTDLFTDTRRQARVASAHNAGQLAVACVNLLRRNPAGLTADEMAERLGKSILSVRPRITELSHAGLIRDSGLRRMARGGMGSSQCVYVLAPERGRP